MCGGEFQQNDLRINGYGISHTLHTRIKDPMVCARNGYESSTIDTKQF